MGKNLATTGLTDQQQLFVLEYARDLDGGKAAIRSGYSPKHAAATARGLLSNPTIADAVRRQLMVKARDARLNAAEVLNHAVRMLQADIADIIDNKGNYKPLSDWPLIWRQMLSACEVSSIRNMKGEEIGSVSRIRFADRVKVLELIGRHIDVRAFAKDDAPPVNPNGVVDVTKVPFDQLIQMRQWLLAAGDGAK